MTATAAMTATTAVTATAAMAATAVTAAVAAVATTAAPRQQPPLFLGSPSDIGDIADALACNCNARLK